jgi:Domain of unknown function (DUF1995)
MRPIYSMSRRDLVALPMLPQNLEEAIIQAQAATKAAIAAGHRKITAEIIYPELRFMGIAEQFLPVFAEYGGTLRVLFTDTGAAALAKRDWPNADFKIADMGSSRSPVIEKIQPEDQLFVAVEPSAVEVEQIEKLCLAADDRPVVLLLPKMEDAAIVGIGYAARQLRDRFISTLTNAYYIKPVSDEVIIYRCFPSPWQVWQMQEDEYQIVAELDHKPLGDELDTILAGDKGATEAATPAGMFAGLQRFMRTLSR